MVMTEERSSVFSIRSDIDLVNIRQAAREWAIKLGFGLVDQTKLVTAVSELGRNMLIFGGGGAVQLQVVDNGSRPGLRLIFEDHGPGIPDLELALKDGFTTGGGLGLGLGGTRRLVHEFDIATQVGEGTRVTITMWKR